ncbi:hypothetical protein TWF730_006509 [Orbilia blumenaviensis]|uniref:Uncharacterized protein n=1 Tax=Orbilia blumenaviensis TaxID=1796055 RepID=A0AAV9VHH3_9PEZI
MVRPRWGWDIDGLLAWVKLGKELTTNSEGTSTRDGLGDANTTVLQWSRVWAVGKVSSSLGEGWDTGNASVLLVGSALEDFLLGCSDGWENIGLAAVIAVCADT